jgi:beta-lactamase regulating signal transducer with metallopeptidase domain
MSADFVARAFSAFFSWVAEPAVRSLAIGSFAGLALAAFRMKRVAARLLVWTAVLCAALLMPFLGSLLPRLPLGVPASSVQRISERVPLGAVESLLQRAELAVRATPVRAASRPLPGSAVEDSRQLPGRERAALTGATGKMPSPHFALAEVGRTRLIRAQPASVNAPTSRAGAPAAMPVTPIPSIAVIEERTGISAGRLVSALLLGIYLLGFAILSARLLVGLWLSGRLGRAAQAIGDREALRFLRFRSCVAGLANPPQLKESSALAVPATVGIWRAAILLPAEWRAWSKEQLAAILAHEISHVARRDALTHTLSLVHRAIFWFSPLGWWLDKQLTDLAEQASDEAVLAGGADRTRYAETLLEFFAQLGAAPGRVWWQGVSIAKAAKAGSAERRVHRILAWRGAASAKKSFAVALIAIAAPLVFLAASVHPFIVRAQGKPPAPSQNVVQPGGPVAPPLPKAPKTPGVVAPALPAAPVTLGPGEGVENPGPVPPAPMTPPAASSAPAPGVKAPPLPKAPRGPGPAGIAPVAPQALDGPVTRKSSPPPSSASTAPAVSLAPVAPQRPGNAASLEDPTAELRATEAMLRAAESRLGSDSAQIRTAQEALAIAAKIIDGRMSSQMPEAREALAEVNRDVQEADQDQRSASDVKVTGNYVSGGGRYVIMSGSDETVEMSGDDEDLQHARHLREKFGNDLIWFERDEKSYVVTDPAFIAKAKALFAPEDTLSKQQDELGRQQDALGKQQDALGEQMDKVKVKVPDISPDLQRINAELDALRASGGTQSELGRLQSELGELQSRIGRFQSDAGVQQSQIGRQQSEIGRQQGELGRQQGELGRRQGELARKASQQLRQMLDDAIASGLAKPE